MCAWEDWIIGVFAENRLINCECECEIGWLRLFFLIRKDNLINALESLFPPDHLNQRRQ